MTKGEAILLASSYWWRKKTDVEIVRFQLWEEKLCMDWNDFHSAVEKTLGRDVYVHEFADIEHLRKEFIEKWGEPEQCQH